MPTGAEIMTRAGVLLQDEGHVRWTLAELCNWINDGQRAIVLAKPSACSGTIVLSLAQGTWQQLPTASPAPLSLIDITRNLLGDGSSRSNSGRAVRPVDRELLDAQDPNWHSSASRPFQREVRNFVFNSDNPREFYVFPGNDGTGKVEALVAKPPTPLVATGDVAEALAAYSQSLDLPEPYSVPLLDYVVYRAHSKDDETGNAPLAQMHYQAFSTALGIKVQVDRTTTPNARRAPS